MSYEYMYIKKTIHSRFEILNQILIVQPLSNIYKDKINFFIIFYVKKFGLITFNITQEAHNKANQVATFVIISIHFCVIFNGAHSIVIKTHA
jgi:hypothetical protein